MDVNGTLYHLISGPRDWGAALDAARAAGAEGLAWDPRRDVVTLERDLLREPPRAGEQVLTPADRRGADRDRFGHFYWLDDDRRTVRYRPAGSRTSARFWDAGELTAPHCPPPPGPGEFTPEPQPAAAAEPVLSGLAVTRSHHLVVGTLPAPDLAGGLLVFDLHGGGPPVWLTWPSPVPFAPFDLAAVPGGGLWILDRATGATAGDARLWRLDGRFEVLRLGPEIEVAAAGSEDFAPDAAEPAGADQPPCPRPAPARRFPGGLAAADASPPEAGEATAVVALPDGSALLMAPDPAAGDTLVQRWSLAGPLGGPLSLAAVLTPELGAAAELVGHDLAFVAASGGADDPGALAGTLYVVSSEGNQSFAFHLDAVRAGLPDAGAPRLVALDAFLPMRRFTGKALVSGGGDGWYDKDDHWLALTELPRPRHRRRGVLQGVVLDGREPGCVWHRLLLDGCIPPGDAVEVESRAADEPAELAGTPWQREPSLRLRPRGSELPFARPAGGRAPEQEAATAAEPAAAGLGPARADTRRDGTWEVLFQSAAGRWLELRLTLRGSGRSSPRLRALRVHYPRFSYVERYLPDTYRDEPASASFLDRFLANFEGFFTELEGRVAAAQVLFDHRTAPAEALDWLAGWLGATLDPDWDDFRRRLFIAHAVELYRRRGTTRGLIEALRLALDPCPDESLFDDSGGDGAHPFGLRLVEGFQARDLPASLLGDPGSPTPAALAAGSRWQAEQGGARLHRLYRDFLRARHAPGSAGDDAAALAALATAWGSAPPSWTAVVWPPLPPAGGARLADWRAFVAAALGPSYAELGAADTGAWRDFLRARYRRIEQLDNAWGLAGDRRHTGFDAVALPAELPADGAALADWFRFAALAVPMARAAHRFTVLVPVGPESTPGERQALLERAAAVVDRERPAHTAFDVQLYWALFRVGAARVGHDTALGESARWTALTLGIGYLGGNLLAEGHPWTIHDRRVVGRDPIAGRPPG